MLLRFKNQPIVATSEIKNYSLIITESRLPDELPQYYFYVRDEELNIISDNSKSSGCTCVDAALNWGLDIIDRLVNNYE
jgi:hypothetical protein